MRLRQYFKDEYNFDQKTLYRWIMREMAGNIQNVTHKTATILYGNTRLME